METLIEVKWEKTEEGYNCQVNVHDEKLTREDKIVLLGEVELIKHHLVASVYKETLQ